MPKSRDNDPLLSRITELEARLKESESTLRRWEEYTKALHQTALGILGELNLPTLLRNILIKAADLLGTDQGYIFLYDEENDELVIRYGIGLFKDEIGFRLRLGEGLSGKVWQFDKPLLVDDYNGWGGRSEYSAWDGMGFDLGIPLKSGDRLIGVIGLCSYEKGKKIGPREILVLSRFADLASIALKNADLHLKLKDEMEQKVRIEARLQQSQKMEAIGTLAGGIAHDFNNLLMGIQGRTSLLMNHLEPETPFLEHLMGIEAYVLSASDLTKQLLGFAQGGKYETKLTDLNRVVEKSADLFGRTRKEIKILPKLTPDIWTVRVDRKQVEQVLLNLFVNAWQAMSGGGSLYLQTENMLLDREYLAPHGVEPGRYVKVSVTDTGCGMEEKILARIFDPFFTTKGMGRGTGLGLASVFGIVKNHKGFVNAYSEVGQGSTFNVYLPAVEGEPIPDEPVLAEHIRGTGNILLVDDEEMILEVGQSLLEELGYQVLIAGTGREAVEMVDRNGDSLRLVILDMIMPDLDGGETFDRIRKLQPDLPVILSSGYSLNGQAATIMNKGCDGFIQKPYNLSELSRTINRLLK